MSALPLSVQRRSCLFCLCSALLTWKAAKSFVPSPSFARYVESKNFYHGAISTNDVFDDDDNDVCRKPSSEMKDDSLNGMLIGSKSRRQILWDVASRSTTGLILGGACGCCHPHTAHALAQITAPSTDAVKAFDLPRNMMQDAAFAQGMAVGMRDYEREAYPIKKRLFSRLFSALDRIEEPAIVEVGMGSFPNALYYQYYNNPQGGLDIIGIDPNDRMEGYARDSAKRAGVIPEERKKQVGYENSASKNSLRIVHGVSEALPLGDSSVDAVVCTLTLCSVVDPARSVAEIRRVLKPGGKFLFWEHVLSETNPALAQQQILLTPNQVKRADGCHLDRQTGQTIRQAGFAKLDLEYLELQGFGFLNPTVCGIATA